MHSVHSDCTVCGVDRYLIIAEKALEAAAQLTPSRRKLNNTTSPYPESTTRYNYIRTKRVARRSCVCVRVRTQYTVTRVSPNAVSTAQITRDLEQEKNAYRFSRRDRHRRHRGFCIYTRVRI